MVNGILMDTVEDTRRSETAIPRGFASGLASATILRNEEALLVVSETDAGRKRDSHDCFSPEVLGGDIDGLLVLFEESILLNLRPSTFRNG